MVNDTERREAARMLLELCDYCDENEMSLCDDDWPGVLSDYIWPEDSGYHTYDEDCRRLADLIEPDTTTDTTKSPDLTTKCDRDALLALADEMERVAPDYSLWEVCEGTERSITDEVADFARRIREALGVES